MSSVIERWHKVVEAQDPSGLADLLADEVVFHSPVVHTPQVGKPITTLYLSAAFKTLNEPGHFKICVKSLMVTTRYWNFRPRLTALPSMAST